VSYADFNLLLPLISLAAAPVVIMLSIVVKRNHAVTLFLTLAGVVAALLLIPVAATDAPREVLTILQIDNFGFYYLGLILCATLAVVLISHSMLYNFNDQREEFYMLLLLGALGSGVLVFSSHFASLFLGLELLGVSLYALIGYRRENKEGIEAALKYLILAAVSSAFLLFGMALIYAESGMMSFSHLAQHVDEGQAGYLFAAGMMLVVVGAGFKLALVPFHMWTPDVYQGAPASVTAFIATVSKGGVLALVFRIASETDLLGNTSVWIVFTLIAIASMFGGNILALLQDNVKRILAYSSIAHFGYVLVAFMAMDNGGDAAAAFYLASYFITIIGAFGVIAYLSSPQSDIQELPDFRALFWKRPWLSAAFTAILLSLAGIPLTIGFIGKYYIVLAGAAASLWGLLVILVVNSVISLYYYLRIVVTMFAPLEEEAPVGSLSFSTLGAGLGVTLTVILLLFWGILPEGVISLVRFMVAL